jgi:cytoskeletal protein RodZ
VRKRVFLAATWLAATTLAIGVTWLALTLVSRQVTDESSAALDASSALSASSTTGSETGTTPATTATGETLVTLPLQPGQTGSPGSPGSGTTRPPSGTTGSTAPPATTAATSGTTLPPPTTTTAPPVTVSQTFNLVGGSVTASCTDDRAALVSAVPNATFDTQVHDNGPSDVDVEFESDTHKSRIKIECVANQPTGSPEETDT